MRLTIIAEYGVSDNALQIQFLELLSDNKIKSQIEEALIYLPNKTVNVGDSWNKILGGINNFPCKIIATYKVKEIRNDTVILDVSGKLDHDQLNSNPTFKDMKMSGGIKGTVELFKTGFTRKSEINADMSLYKIGSDMKTINIKMSTMGTVK